MDGERFDAIAKATATASRRGALRLLAAGAGAAVAGVLGISGAGANHLGACRGTGARCNGDDQCCSHRCRKKVCRCAGAGGPWLRSGHCGGAAYCQPGGTCSDACAGNWGDGNRDCCASAPCDAGTGTCGGCAMRATFCSATRPCCFSECNGGACFSAAGQRCAQDKDCRACYFDPTKCAGACGDNGLCAV